MKSEYPWSAVVGQGALKQALVLCAIDPAIGGVLVQGPRGVAKTTLARALSELVAGPFVELPLGASEERITGSLDLGVALGEQRVQYAPGLLSRAHKGVLYVDEVNLLPDAIVDLLLDAAATGRNVVERDGVSQTHAARFVLIGTMNPEEGELRPQLIDRFGLCAYAEHEIVPAERAEIVRRRLAFDRDPSGFVERHAPEQRALLERCLAARARVEQIALDGESLEWVAERCHAAGVEGVRADLAMSRAARAHAAWHGRGQITQEDVDAVAELALSHRRKAAGPAAGGGGMQGGAGRGGASGAPRAGGLGAAGSGAQDQRGPESAKHGAAGPRAAEERDPAARAHGSRAVDGVHAAMRGTGDRHGRERDSAAVSTARPAAHGGKDAGQQRGALPAIPVPAAALPTRNISLRELTSRRPAAHRRGRPQLTAALGARARGLASQGAIDWFATLSRTSRPGPEQLIRRARRGPAKQLWILLLDCSASMLRHGALAQAKAVAHGFEMRAARAGAHVAILSFQGAGARLEVSSRAGRSVVERGIAALGGGGATPLREAVLSAQRLCEQRDWRAPEIAKRIIVFTDARTREQVADIALVRPERELLVIDCERGPVRLQRGPGLAAALGGSYRHVDTLL